MSRFSVVYFLGGTVVVGAGVYALRATPVTHDQVRRNVTEIGEHARLEALEQEVADLKRNQVRTVREVLIAPPEDGRAGMSATAPAAAPHGPLAASSAEITVTELHNEIQVRFNGEGKDRSWSTDTRLQVLQGLTSRLPANSRLLSVECRETMCRVESSHDNMEAFRTFIRSDVGSPELGWKGPMTATIERSETDGSVVAVAFLGRGPGSLWSER